MSFLILGKAYETLIIQLTGIFSLVARYDGFSFLLVK